MIDPAPFSVLSVPDLRVLGVTLFFLFASLRFVCDNFRAHSKENA